MNYDNYYKNGGMTKEESISAIALRIGARKEAVAKFVEENDIDTNKMNSDLKSGKVYFMDVITAIVGKPNNKYQKEIIKKYSSKMAMGGKTQGYDDREDERLGMDYGKISGKDFVGSHSRMEHARRDDARFEERMAKGGEFRANRSALIKYANFGDGSHINLLSLNPIKTTGATYKEQDKFAISMNSVGGEQKVMKFKTLAIAESKFEELVDNKKENVELVKEDYTSNYPNEYAHGGKLEVGVYRIGKPKRISDNLYEQKIVEIFDNGDISTASDYGRKLGDFKSQMYPIITQEQFEAQYKYAKGGVLKEGDYVWNAVGNKLVVNKVSDDEYFLSAFGQFGDSPFSKEKVEMYLKNGQWSRKPKMAKGGAIEDQYVDRTAEDIWDSLSQNQRSHFIRDHALEIEMMSDKNYDDSTNQFPKEMTGEFVKKAYRSDWKDLDEVVQNRFANHVRMGEYAKGGALPKQNQLNKKVLDLIQKANIESKLELGQLVVSALTDANAHSEVRKFISIMENKPEWAEKPKEIDMKLPREEFEKQRAKTVYGSKYYDANEKTDDLGRKIASMFGWDIVDISDALIFASKMSGRNDVAQALEKLDSDDDNQDATKNKWDYTDVDDIEYVVVKDKSGKELKFAGKHVLSGVHDLLEKGGKLSEKGKYYSKDNVVSVVVGGKNIIDKNTVSGVWIMKDAKPIADDVADMKIGKTTIRKGFNGWVGKTMVDNFKGFDWDITTIKTSRGDLVTSAQGGKSKDEGGYKSFSFMMFQDPNIRLKVSRPARVTDKVVSAQHEEALKEFKERQEEIAEMVDQIQAKKKMADGGAIGFDALAKKVAKNYEGDKVKKQYQNEYGKTYDKKEAEEVGKKVAAKVYRQQKAKSKMAKGGETSNYRNNSKLARISAKAKEIRKANEPWRDAFKRAKTMIG